MANKTIKVGTVGQALLEILRDRGVDYVIGNAFTSIIDGFARFEAESKKSPRPLMVPHEQVAIAMAHGYYEVTGRPQVAIVYSTPGTANAAGAIINAARARVPMVILAARSAATEESGIPGARDIHVQWAQESFDQAGMVREYLKWDYELRHPAQLESVVDRAFELAMDEPRGPVYLSLPRDLIAQPLDEITIRSPSKRSADVLRYPDPAKIDAAAEILAEAKRPLVITSELGRNSQAVAALVDLAEACAAEVLEASPTHANFPADHPSHIGYVFGSQIHTSVAKADAILVIDCDVPWFNSRVKIRDRTRVIQLGTDPFFGRYPMRNFRCDVPIAADPVAALPLLIKATKQRVGKDLIRERRRTLAKRHQAADAKLEKSLQREAARVPIGFQWASKCIGDLQGPNTLIVNEYPLDLRHATPLSSGSYLGASHAGGLGWGFGAALGAQLGSPERTVIATLGDGSYIFSVPTACHQAARLHELPVLTVIFNNGGWDEVSNSTRNVHPDGWAVSTGNFPMVSMGPSPRFEEIVSAFDGHGERVEEPSELPGALKRGLEIVQKERRQVLVNVICRR